MASIKYTSMAYKNADDMVMGTAVHPSPQGYGLKIRSRHGHPRDQPRPQARKGEGS
jgi:methanol--5-hydroxybenzimidazolylcobamide Co-methyltransferase